MKPALLAAWILSAIILLGSTAEDSRADASGRTERIVGAQRLDQTTTGCPYLESIGSASSIVCPFVGRAVRAPAVRPAQKEKAERGLCPYGGGGMSRPGSKNAPGDTRSL